MRLGEATPAIVEPGAALDLLTGPWLEPAADGRLRISPVLSGAGLKVLSESEQTRFHEAIAEFLAARRPVRTGDLPQLVLSGLRTGSQKALGLVARLALGGQLPDSVLGRGLYPLAFMKTDAPLSDQLMINAPLRAAQVKVAALNGMARPAIEAFRALERETPDDEVGGVFRLVTVFSLLTGPLELWASDWLPLVLNIPVDAVDRTTACWRRRRLNSRNKPHDRQIVLLPPGAGVHWLDLSAAEDLMLQPAPAGSLTVQKIWPETP